MDQFVPAEWRTSSMGEAVAPLSCGEDDGLVELLWCGGHVAREHAAAPWFQYPVVDDPLDKDIFSEIFGEMQAAADAGWVAGTGTTGDSAPPRGGKTNQSISYHDASTTVTASSTRPRAPGGGKRKQRDTSEGPSEVMQDAEGSDSAAEAVTTRGPTTAKRRRAAQEHNLSERRRRDRINEKMRALQELVPHCNKTDKASMLDEAIQYLKSLQLQVQMMWTTGMAPATATGAHRYMQRMASTRFRIRRSGLEYTVYSSSIGTQN